MGKVYIFILAIFFAVFGPHGLICLQKQEKSLMAVIDAGSTGNRIYIYPYKLYYNTGQIYLDPQAITHKIQPPLASFTKNPELAGRSLRPLLNFYLSKIEEYGFLASQCFLFVKATGGLRMVSDRAKADRILESVNEQISMYKFKNTIKDEVNKETALKQSDKNSSFHSTDSTRIISGFEEGLFGWLSLNYLLKTKKPIGLLEMGGSSLQVVIETPSSKNQKGVSPLTEHCSEITFVISDINSTSYRMKESTKTLISCSFPLLGLQAIQKEVHFNTDFDVAALSHIVNGIEYKHPCYPKGYRFSSSRANGDKKNFIGSGDFNMCYSLIADYLDRKVNVAEEKKLIHANMHSSIFFGIENFYYTTKFFGMVYKNRILDSNKLLAKAKVFCETNWEDLQLDYLKEPLYDLKKYCFSSIYISLYFKYFFFEGIKVKVIPKNTINGNDINWTIGSAFFDIFNLSMVVFTDVKELIMYNVRHTLHFSGCLFVGILIAWLLKTFYRMICIMINKY